MQFYFKGERIPLTQDNLTIFNYVGELAMFNHAFLQVGESEEGIVGQPYFETIPNHNDIYQTLADFALENECEMHLNAKYITEEAYESYVKNASVDVERSDYFPEDWM